MKMKYLSLGVVAFIVIVTVAQAQRIRRTPVVIDEVVVSPLAGYADQIQSLTVDYLAPAAELAAPASESLLDEPIK